MIKKLANIIAILMALMVIISACNQQETTDNTIEDKPKKKLEMYEASELSVLMRKMQKEMEMLKADIDKNGQENVDLSNYLLDYKEITTANPTDNKTKDVTYLGFATVYLEKTNALKNSNKEDLIFNYNNTINACIACHEKHCSGPIKMINGLKIN